MTHINKIWKYSVLICALAGLLLAGCGKVGPNKNGEGNFLTNRKKEAETVETSDSIRTESSAEDTLSNEENPDGTVINMGGDNSEEVIFENDTEEVAAKNDESPATGYLVSEHERTLEAMTEYLQNLPKDVESIAKEGGLAIEWDEVWGMANMEAFLKRYEAGEEAEIVIMQYTTEGNLIFDYLYYDTEKIKHIHDASGDAFGDPDTAIYEEEFVYLLSFTQKAEERDRLRTLVLSGDADMTFDVFENLWYSGDGEKNGQIRFITSFFYTDADL